MPKSAGKKKILTPSSDELSGGKKALFHIMAAVFPFFLLALAEVGLRVVGFGEVYPLFKPVPGYEAYYQPGEDVARRYFSSIENVPGIPFDSFQKEKDESGLRIFVQGGSTAAGFPFYFGGSFPDMLEQRLLMTFPGRQVEVINTAMAAVNSYTLLDFRQEILDQQPDAILIYAGHNEYYGALGVGSSQLLGRQPAVVNLYLRIQDFRIVQGLRRLLGWGASLFGGGADTAPQGATLMQNMVGEQRIPLHSDLYHAGLHQFEYNLSRLLDFYEQAGVPVFIATLASNERDQAPFISGTSGAFSEDDLLQRVREAGSSLARGDSSAALVMLNEIVQSDTLFAASVYARAKIHDLMGNHKAAGADYERARELDELRFRAPEQMNAIIREQAAKYGAQIVEAAAALRGVSPGGIIGSNVMLEHLHPNISGLFVLSDAFYNALAQAGLGVEDGVEWDRFIDPELARSNLLVTPLDSLVGLYRFQQLTASWPFKAPGARPIALDTLGASTPVGELALKLYKRDIRRLDALDQLQRMATRSGDFVTALQSIFAIIQRYPFLPGPYLSAANIQVRIGRHEEAEQYVLASLERGDSAEGRQILGSLLLNRGMSAEAIPHLEQALVLDANIMGARYNLAGAFALQKEFEQAREQAEEVLRRNPENQDARRLLDSLPE